MAKTLGEVRKELLVAQMFSILPVQCVERALAIGAVLKAVLETEGRLKAQEWGMKALKHASGDEIDRMTGYWPDEIVELMSERLLYDGRFNGFGERSKPSSVGNAHGRRIKLEFITDE